MDNATLLHNTKMSQTWGTLQVIILASVFLIVSVMKPWNKKKNKAV